MSDHALILAGLWCLGLAGFFLVLLLGALGRLEAVALAAVLVLMMAIVDRLAEETLNS